MIVATVPQTPGHDLTFHVPLEMEYPLAACAAGVSTSELPSIATIAIRTLRTLFPRLNRPRTGVLLNFAFDFYAFTVAFARRKQLTRSRSETEKCSAVENQNKARHRKYRGLNRRRMLEGDYHYRLQGATPGNFKSGP